MEMSSVEDLLEIDVTPGNPEQGVPFEFSCIVKGSYPEYDNAVRWCWSKFGSQHGDCWSLYSDYPACPLVLEKDDSDPKSVVEHSHVGRWAIEWLEKVAYDYGFGRFSFRLAADRDAFVANVPNIDWGEKYPDT
jgi:hypothetical protein